MIAIISSTPRERAALSDVCEHRQWNVSTCDSLRAFRRLIARSTPTVVLSRGKLVDGFCDQIITSLPQGARLIVLIDAGTSSAVEARLVALGADCVLRDPVHTDVLTEYIEKYAGRRIGSVIARPAPPKQFRLAGMTVDIVNRRLQGKAGRIPLTPREVALAQLLVEAAGEVVTYETLYHELLGRRFKGETSNMRVLLGKLIASTQKAGTDLRQQVDVIPKTGYRYAERPTFATP